MWHPFLVLESFVTNMVVLQAPLVCGMLVVPSLVRVHQHAFSRFNVVVKLIYEDLKACNYSAFSWKPDNCMP